MLIFAGFGVSYEERAREREREIQVEGELTVAAAKTISWNI